MTHHMGFNIAAGIAPAGELALVDHMRDVALELLGEPNKQLSGQHELRFGQRGSLSVDLEKGTFYDHEKSECGGVLDLIGRERNITKGQAADWLRERAGQARSPAPPTKSATTKANKHKTDTYKYEDENGAHLFDVIRFEPKDFRQRAPDGAWTVKGIRKVLYRLPKIAAAPDGSTIYLVEGEKDVHALEAKGLLATTNPGGAGKWNKDYATTLRGKNVVILPDNDQTGRDHATKVQESLRGAGVSCAVLELLGLPEKGDVSDWLAKGNAPAELERLAKEALQITPKIRPDNSKFSLIRADQLEFKEPDYLVTGLIEAETLALLFADPGSGKSFVAMDIAASIATGCGFHGRDVRQGAVIYICGEGKNGVKRRLTAWERHHGASLNGKPLFVSSVAARFLSPESISEIIAAIDVAAQEAGSVAMIIIDTLNRNMGAGDESSTADMTAFISAVDAVKDRYDATALIVHHTGHGNKERARGSMAMLGALDAEYRIEKDESIVTITNTKMKEAATPPPIAFKLVEIEVGKTRLGEPITSAALTETDPPEPKKSSLSPNQKLALEALKQFIADNGQPTPGGTGWPEPGSKNHVNTDEFMTFLKGKMTADSADSRRRTAKRAFDDLLCKGAVQTNEGCVWIL